jgi:hypothetical protein
MGQYFPIWAKLACQELFGSLELVSFEGFDHFPHLEEPHRFVNYILPQKNLSGVLLGALNV